MKIDPLIHREQTEEERRFWKRVGFRTEMFRVRGEIRGIRNATSIRYFARYNIDTRTHVHAPWMYIRPVYQ